MLLTGDITVYVKKCQEERGNSCLQVSMEGESHKEEC